jgi:hypothetical protein
MNILLEGFDIQVGLEEIFRPTVTVTSELPGNRAD